MQSIAKEEKYQLFWNFCLNILMNSLRHKMAGLVRFLLIQRERERERERQTDRQREIDVEFLIIDCNARNKSHMHMNLCFEARNVQGDQKVSVHLMITIQNVTSNVQSAPRQSPDIIDTPKCVLEDRVQYSTVHGR
jgi:hypothetical protein